MIQLLKTGLILLMVAFSLWIYENEFENALPISSNLDSFLGILGAVLLVVAILGFVFGKLFGKTAKWRKKTHCVRCGAKIGKNEMYCAKHKNEIAAEYLKGRNPNSSYH